MRRFPEQFSNNAATTLTADLTVDGTLIRVKDGDAFPRIPQFRVLVGDEIMIVVAAMSSLRWRVVRGAEGTTPTAHSSHTAVTHIVTAAAISTLRNLCFDVREYGAEGDGVTDDTEAIQAAIDAAGAAHGVAYVPASSRPYLFSELRLMPYMKLAGAHMRQTQLKCLPRSRGIAVRERSVVEGNPNGATAIWLENLTVDGANTDGDGIDLGNHGTYQLSTAAGISNLHVTRFRSGIGMNLNANAVSFHYLYATENRIGIRASGGGANVFHSMWSEYNTEHQLEVGDLGDVFFGCQFEDGSSRNPIILVTGLQNSFYGVYVSIAADKGDIILNDAGANRNAYYNVYVDARQHQFQNLINHVGANVGTGSSDYLVHSYVIGENTGAASWYVNGSTGRTIKIAADLATFSGGVATRVLGGPPTDSDLPGAADGMMVVDAKHQRLYIRIAGVWRYVSTS